MFMYYVFVCGFSLLKMFCLEKMVMVGGIMIVSVVLVMSVSSFDIGVVCEVVVEMSEGISDFVFYCGFVLLVDRVVIEEVVVRSVSGCGCGGVVVMGFVRSMGGVGSVMGVCVEYFGCFCVGG